MQVVRSPACVARLVWANAVPGLGASFGGTSSDTFLPYAQTSNWTFIHDRFVGVLLDEDQRYVSGVAYDAAYGEGKLAAVFNSAQRVCTAQRAHAWVGVVTRDTETLRTTHAETMPLQYAWTSMLMFVCIFLWTLNTRAHGKRTSVA